MAGNYNNGLYSAGRGGIAGNQPVAANPAPSAAVGANANGFTPANGPSAVFSGAMPAVDFKANPYLLNQVDQFRQMQNPNQGTMNAFNARLQGMGGQAQSLFNPVQDASLGKGLLGANFQLGTELPGYTPDNQVGFKDTYNGVEQKVGADPLAGGDYAGATDASGQVPNTSPYTYYTPTGQNIINMSKLQDSAKSPLTNQLGYQIWNGDNGKPYASLGDIPVAINPKTGALNFAGKENIKLDTPLGLLNADIVSQNKKTGLLTLKDSKLGTVYYDPATKAYSQPVKKGKK